MLLDTLGNKHTNVFISPSKGGKTTTTKSIPILSPSTLNYEHNFFYGLTSLTSNICVIKPPIEISTLIDVI